MTDVVIWKYELKVTDHATLTGPGLSEVIFAAATGHDTISVWAHVVPELADRTIKLELRGTGQFAPDLYKFDYVTSVMTGIFIWHIYQETTDD